MCVNLSKKDKNEFFLRRRFILHKEANLQENDIYVLQEQKIYIHIQYATHNRNVKVSGQHHINQNRSKLCNLYASNDRM